MDLASAHIVDCLWLIIHFSCHCELLMLNYRWQIWRIQLYATHLVAHWWNLPILVFLKLFVCSSLRCLYRPTSAAGDEEPVADQVTGEEQTTEEALPQTQAFLVQREAQVHQLTYGSQWVQISFFFTTRWYFRSRLKLKYKTSIWSPKLFHIKNIHKRWWNK